MEFRFETLRDHVTPPTQEERRRTRERLQALAVPRLTGTEGAQRTATELRGGLEALGYEIRELPFSFSQWPGRFALAAGGGVFLLGVLIATGFLWAGNGLVSLIALLVGAASASAIALSALRASTSLRWGRVETANWLVHRPGARPRWLLVAHRDSKSQLLPTAMRVAAIVVGVAAWVGLLVLSLAELLVAGRLPLWPVLVVGGLAALCSGLIALCWVGNDSPGAVDNATGLAALLGLAERERDSDDVAFLVTDGEELMLAGAYAVAPTLPPIEGVINLDVLDDEGTFSVVDRHGYPRRGVAPHLVAALLSAAHALDVPARRRDMPIGVMADHMAFTEAGLPSVTLHRGTVSTFHRVHRPADDLENLRGDGAATAVAMVDGALRILRGELEVGSEEPDAASGTPDAGRGEDADAVTARRTPHPASRSPR